MTRVLVVDDDADITTLVEFRLELAGFEVSTEIDGEAALQAIKDDQPELVILDWMMPRMSGLDVCAAMRADAELQQIPVILLTAKAQEEDIQRGFAAGADDYIVKPFSPRELLSRVEATMSRTRR